MKKEKDAIKNSTKELTKAELVYKFQTAPLDLKFYGQVEELHNQQILSRKEAQQREIEAFKKSELGVIAKLQEVYDKECKNFENLEKKHKKRVSRNAMDEAAAELMHAKRLYEEKLKEKTQTSEKKLLEDLQKMEEDFLYVRDVCIKSCSWDINEGRLDFYESQFRDPKLSEEQLQEKYGNYYEFSLIIYREVNGERRIIEIPSIMAKSVVDIRPLREGETIEDFVLNKIRRNDLSHGVIGSQWAS